MFARINAIDILSPQNCPVTLNLTSVTFSKRYLYFLKFILIVLLETAGLPTSDESTSSGANSGCGLLFAKWAHRAVFSSCSCS